MQNTSFLKAPSFLEEGEEPPRFGVSRGRASRCRFMDDLIWLPKGAEPPPLRGGRKGPELDENGQHDLSKYNARGLASMPFTWTKEELNDATRIAMDRLYKCDPALDHHLPRSLHLDRVAVRVAKEKSRIGQAEYQRIRARYGNG